MENPTIYSDRFIPSRKGSNFALFDLPTNSSCKGGNVKNKPFGSAYNELLRTVLFGPDNGNIFKFKNEAPHRSLLPPMSEDDLLPPVVKQQPKKSHRKVNLSLERVLHAPNLRDDFYSNLLDWSSQNVLAAGLGTCVYLWNAHTRKATKLLNLGDNEENDMVCSVGWAQRGTHLAVGTNTGKLLILDVSSQQRTRTMEGHSLKVGALAWSSTLLASGSLDSTILQRDIRAPGDFVSKLTGHSDRICGLKWSCDGRQLASGGDDRRVIVWNRHSTQPVLTHWEHTAAVRALAWSPHDFGLLASGGGLTDRTIRIWNTTTDSHLRCVETGGQVCNMLWSKNVDQLVSTHGGICNEMTIWEYPKMVSLATIDSHTERALHMAVSPNGQTIVTGAGDGDEKLKFWNVFPPPKSHHYHSSFETCSSLGRTYIR